MPDDTAVASQSDDRTANNGVRHQYRALTETEKGQMVALKDAGAAFIGMVDACGACREYSIAKTKIEEAVMWAVKGLTA